MTMSISTEMMTVITVGNAGISFNAIAREDTPGIAAPISPWKNMLSTTCSHTRDKAKRDNTTRNEAHLST